MAVATFDTLKFANSLKAAGVPEKQAEAEAAAISEALAANFKDLATKEDLQHLRSELKNDSREIEQRLNAKIDTAVAKLSGELVLMKYMFGMVVTIAVGLMVRLIFVRIP